MFKTIVLSALAIIVLAGASLFSYGYFKSHYVLLNEQDLMMLNLQVQAWQEEAYQVGKQACNKTL